MNARPFSIVSGAWSAIGFSRRWRGDDLASAKAAALLFYLAVTRDE